MKLRHSTLLARRSGNRGMTMIEVLVTLVIVSFGLLGVGALQLMSLQVNQGANQRSQASMLALSALDAMRGNRANALNYARSYGAAAPSYTATNIHDQDLAAIWTAPISRFTRAAQRFDQHVDPRIGRFDVASRQVVALD